ncbi:MAG: hypothetical protein AB1797_05350 [bacterium]
MSFGFRVFRGNIQVIERETKLSGCIGCILWLLLMSANAEAQIEGNLLSPEAVSVFAGTQFYSRTVEYADRKEEVQAWVFPLFVTGAEIKGWNIWVHQPGFSAQLKGDSSVSGLADTRIRASRFFLDETAIVAGGLSLPLTGIEPEADLLDLEGLLNTEVLQFPVSKLTEGFDLDLGIAWAKTFKTISVSMGGGYLVKGSYDRIYQVMGDEASVGEYDPGNELSLTAGFNFRRGITSLHGKILYLRYGDDTLKGEYMFTSGPELSGYLSATFRFRPVTLILFAKDTIKDEDSFPQDIDIPTRNSFATRFEAGTGLICPLLDEAIILKAETSMKNLSDADGEITDQVLNFNLGGQVSLRPDLVLEAKVDFLLNGYMDDGEADISGFGLGLLLHYSFGK